MGWAFPYLCFNLVIEILFFSSSTAQYGRLPLSFLFQSRNRDTFLFKIILSISKSPLVVRFNLVIEILFFSSLRQTAPMQRLTLNLFQSRNRDTFLFKGAEAYLANVRNFKFQSRNRDTFLFKSFALLLVRFVPTGFNLVIEILFFSS